jgi:hypothetical protein
LERTSQRTSLTFIQNVNWYIVKRIVVMFIVTNDVDDSCDEHQDERSNEHHTRSFQCVIINIRNVHYNDRCNEHQHVL